jgi:Cap4 SAVED domain
LLLSDKADLTDEALTTALRKYFDRSSPMSNRVRYCGVTLVGFGAPFYPGEGATTLADEIATAAQAALADWVDKVGKGVTKNKLDTLEIEFFCVPLPSAQDFRDAFLQVMGLKA